MHLLIIQCKDNNIDAYLTEHHMNHFVIVLGD